MRHEPDDEPSQRRIEQEIIERREHAPEEREQRADQALNVAPAVGIIPEAQVHDLEAHQARDVFQRRHREGHAEEHHKIIPPTAAELAEDLALKFAENEQDDRAEAVERHAWAEEEAGVQPFALRIRAGEEAAEKQLQHPAAAGAEEEQKYND